MPNIKSAKKRVLVSKVNKARNKMEKSALKTTLKRKICTSTARIILRPWRKIHLCE